jgi:geranylgeranyl pyrophosphate synthase
MSTIKRLKTICDNDIERFIQTQPDNYKNILNDIFNGGKRLRQMIFLYIVENLNTKNSLNIMANNIALAIEIFHNSSLILDDLPCMDNDEYRRDTKTIHKKYGYDVAIQFSLYLIKCGLKLMYDNLKLMSNNIELIFIYNKIINENLGKNGLIDGQKMDLDFFKNKIGINSKKQHKELIYKKTTTLFNLSFALSYVLFDKSQIGIDTILKASRSFGLLFQLYDDFTDVDQDKLANTPNFILKYGRDKTYTIYNKNIQILYKMLEDLDIDKKFFIEIIEMLSFKISHVY